MEANQLRMVEDIVDAQLGSMGDRNHVRCLVAEYATLLAWVRQYVLPALKCPYSGGNVISTCTCQVCQALDYLPEGIRE
jgi:hypothetical protein